MRMRCAVHRANGNVQRRSLLAALTPLLGIAALTVPMIAGSARRGAEIKDISDYTIQAKDLTATLHVTKFDTKELEKIGSDFTTTYSLRNLTLSFKNPDKIRLEGKSPTRGTALMILNGPDRYFEVPKFNIHKTENLTKSPGKRQSLLEFGGVLSAETLRFMEGSFVKQEPQDGQMALAYDLKYQGSDTGSHYRVWINPQTRITVKREWYDSENQLRATFTYLEPHEVGPNVWLPGRVEVRNAEGNLGAVIALDTVKINQGLADSLFEVTRQGDATP